ncbi:hypothetical protein BDA99DRAFT_540623 [Phascolomyces articulosus]|uniref:Uncharacterized protein n=1 Tax=Phascolomyces articulosus TaxID=60185 RepID=A0AAD5PAU0_9FUNG|nr:hypothetical protein BDA99DRAFT_540623 [Phascolomyces articulosus]
MSKVTRTTTARSESKKSTKEGSGLKNSQPIVDEIDELESSDDDNDYNHNNPNVTLPFYSFKENTDSHTIHGSLIKDPEQQCRQSCELVIRPYIIQPDKRQLSMTQEFSPVMKRSKQVESTSDEIELKQTFTLASPKKNISQSPSPSFTPPSSPITREEIEACLFLHPELRRQSSRLPPPMDGYDEDDEIYESSDPGDFDFFKYYGWNDCEDQESSKQDGEEEEKYEEYQHESHEHIVDYQQSQLEEEQEEKELPVDHQHVMKKVSSM